MQFFINCIFKMCGNYILIYFYVEENFKNGCNLIITQIKEEHLNNLLEAKSLALTQADRVIAQLRATKVSHSAEVSFVCLSFF